MLLLSKDAGAFDHIGLDQGLLLRFFGNAVYYVLLTKGVRLAGVPTSGMLMALIPLNVALLTNRPGAETTVVVPWRRLSLPLAMILIGLWIGNIDEFSEISVATSSVEYWLGFCAASERWRYGRGFRSETVNGC